MRLYYLLCVLSMLLTGCSILDTEIFGKIGPDYVEPQIELPADYSSTNYGNMSGSLDKESERLCITDPVQSLWWTRFNDELLSSLIQDAAKNNKSVLQAISRINQSRAYAKVAFAGLLPAAQVDGSYAEIRDSGNRMPAEFGSGSYAFELYSASLDAVWELDVFGRLRRNLEAKDALYDASVASLHDVLRMVVAEIGIRYFELRGYQAQLKIAKENLQAQQETVRIVKEKLRNGLVGELDAVRAEAVLAETSALVPPLEAAVRRCVYRLLVLVGDVPSELNNDLASRLMADSNASIFKGSIGIGHPADMIRRRPDIRAAERMLASYTAQIGVAVGELFPKVSISGSVGVDSSEMSGLLEGGTFYSFGPKISWTPLDLGRRRSEIHAADAKAEEALRGYESAVLNAMEDVENALSGYAAQRARKEQLIEAVRASNRAYVLAKDQYQEGVLDLLSVLDAERSKLKNESSLSESETALALSVVGIYKALGGGWEGWELVDLHSAKD